MGRHAKILGVAPDFEGYPWDVKEWRPTPHGWSIAIGWPAGLARGRGGCGGPRVILTRELVDHMESVRHRLNPSSAAALPIGRPQLKRLRRLLGHDRKADRRDWWESHADELSRMPFPEFADRHGVSSSAAELMFEEIFGHKRGHPRSWWDEPVARELLSADLPTVEVADRLGRSIRAVWTGRYRLKSGAGF